MTDHVIHEHTDSASGLSAMAMALIVIALVALGGLFVYAMNTGMFNQSTQGNDLNIGINIPGNSAPSGDGL